MPGTGAEPALGGWGAQSRAAQVAVPNETRGWGGGGTPALASSAPVAAMPQASAPAPSLTPSPWTAAPLPQSSAPMAIAPQVFGSGSLFGYGR